MTPKQQIFVNEYLKCWNATEAARRAKYQGNDATLAQVGAENLRKPYIAEIIQTRLKENAMSADEVLSRLANIARGNIADVAHVATSSDVVDLGEDAAVIRKMKRKVTTSKDGETYEDIELEMYSAHGALRDIGRHYGLFTDKVEHSGEVHIKGYTDKWSPDDWDEDS